MNNPNAPLNLTPLQARARSCLAPIARRRQGAASRPQTLPDAILFAAGVLNDATEDSRYCLKAAEIILAAGLPKDPDAISKALGESDGPNFLEVVFVKPGEVIEHQPKPSGNGNGTFSVSFDEPARKETLR
jgi:hypothetical protein